MSKAVSFENEETEKYFYEVVKKYGIGHISFENNTIITKEDINELVQVISNIKEEG